MNTQQVRYYRHRTLTLVVDLLTVAAREAKEEEIDQDLEHDLTRVLSKAIELRNAAVW